MKKYALTIVDNEVVHLSAGIDELRVVLLVYHVVHILLLPQLRACNTPKSQSHMTRRRQQMDTSGKITRND
jgi:hypothetical protein